MLCNNTATQNPSAIEAMTMVPSHMTAAGKGDV